MNLSLVLSLLVTISGSEVTPIALEILSPIDRVIARPGISSSGSHTLSGPANSPIESVP